MLTTKFNTLNSIITEDIADVLSYYIGLNKDDITPDILAQRIVAELPVKLGALCNTIGVTTLSYLDADARESISQWQAINKNLYYEAELSEKIASDVSASHFLLQSYVTLRHSVTCTIVTASSAGIYLLPPLQLFFPIPSFAIKLLIVAAIAGGSFVAVPKITADHEKTNILKQLEDYLNEIQLELNKQINVIKEAYSKEFNMLASQLGEK